MQNKINIVLVEPQIPQNTGNIARTCSVTGASLHIIKPMGFTIDDKKLKRAGLDYWQFLDITYYENIEDFYSKHQDNSKFYYFTTKGAKRYSDVEYNGNVFLFFGREDQGINEVILHDNYEKCVRVPMKSECRSLNLSNTVCLATYEVLRQWDFDGLQEEGHLTKF